MGWNIYSKERGGRYYWYAQRSVRVPGKRYPKTETRYIGPARGGGHPGWPKSDIKNGKIGARWKLDVMEQQRNRTPDEKDSIRRFNGTIRELQYKARADEELHKLEARENARQPATEAARDRYMALREQQQAEIRSYWKTVEDERERTEKANEQYAAEQKATNPSEPSALPAEPSPQGEPAPDAEPSSSDGPR